mgnify:CR=1 FL=1
MTTSLKVAEFFGKQHKDVLKAIRNLITTAQNCALVDNQVVRCAFEEIDLEQPMPVGNGFKKVPAYALAYKHGTFFLTNPMFFWLCHKKYLSLHYPKI